MLAESDDMLLFGLSPLETVEDNQSTPMLSTDDSGREYFTCECCGGKMFPQGGFFREDGGRVVTYECEQCWAEVDVEYE